MQLNETEKQALVSGPGNYVGLTADDEAAEWLWNQKLSIVGADNPAFEVLPFSNRVGGANGKSFHQVMIGGKCLGLGVEESAVDDAWC